ncbi:MAG: hypothetical protein A2Z83_05835 [Omnitrophica bacterium GWA2_52_8]|nr:MAG: hypothetical protein A2Z83_05835 [Omnitrophica bacterium GWA2_52_8]
MQFLNDTIHTLAQQIELVDDLNMLFVNRIKHENTFLFVFALYGLIADRRAAKRPPLSRMSSCRFNAVLRNPFRLPLRQIRVIPHNHLAVGS